MDQLYRCWIADYGDPESATDVTAMSGEMAAVSFRQDLSDDWDHPDEYVLCVKDEEGVVARYDTWREMQPTYSAKVKIDQ